MIKMRFEGGAELARRLAELSLRASKDVMRNALKAGAKPMADTMSARAPKGDPAAPNLSDVVIMASRNEIASGDAAQVAVGPRKGAHHAHLQEYGTVHHGAQPFARPAFDENINRSLSVVNLELRRVLIGSAMTAQGPSEAFGQPEAEDVVGGPGSSLL